MAADKNVLAIAADIAIMDVHDHGFHEAKGKKGFLQCPHISLRHDARVIVRPAEDLYLNGVHDLVLCMNLNIHFAMVQRSLSSSMARLEQLRSKNLSILLSISRSYSLRTLPGFFMIVYEAQ